MRAGYLYVAIGARGLVKVGRSSKPKQRIVDLRNVFRKMNDEVEKFIVTEFVECWWTLATYERKLIEFVNSMPDSVIAKGNEFFYKVDVDLCVKKAHELASDAVRLAEIRRLERIEQSKIYLEKQRKLEEKRMRRKEKLRNQYFDEFIELQKQGLIPIPEVINAQAS